VFRTLESKKETAVDKEAIQKLTQGLGTKEAEIEKITKTLVGDYQPFDVRAAMMGGLGRKATLMRYGNFLKKQSGEPE
jgi:hypothetical protein